MWSNKKNAVSVGLFQMGRQAFFPFVLMALCTPSVLFLWYIVTHCQGDLTVFASKFSTFALAESTLSEIMTLCTPTLTAWKMLGIYTAFELALTLLVPGAIHRGPVTPAGNVPIYTVNGFTCYAITLLALIVFGSPTILGFDNTSLHLFNPGSVYDELGPIFGATITVALALCLFLTFKGLYFPSSDDCGSTGNFVMDYYWGTELYPKIFGVDVKLMTNCRLGMMGWAVLLVCYCFKQCDINGGEVKLSLAISVSLQLIYICKFFWWEAGYWNSIDIMHDRAGYYLCWGCLNWVPCLYTLSSMYLVENQTTLSYTTGFIIYLLGYVSIFLNYDSDNQRYIFRKSKGKCLVFGKPAKLIRAQYVTEKGDKKESLLLVSGYWAISRHFHYLPELSASFFWAAPSLFTNFIPYLYVMPYLHMLLFDRAFRDDARCGAKYGKYWDEYKKAVPYRVIPGII